MNSEEVSNVHAEGSGADRRERLVVVGVDGSESSSAALRWAADEARLRGATLKVVEAWHIPSVGYGAYVAIPEGFEDWAKEAAASLEEQLAEVLGDEPGVTVVREVVEGPAAKVILDAAEGAELLVVGSRGRGGFSGLLLGSVSAHVAHHAPCPVTIVRTKARAKPSAQPASGDDRGHSLE
ncbi:MAG TPA: universal stress protein [Acidimicrobiales bacterium]|nr:universal stress protein [Acidimicrobiales bacterium]